MRTLFDTTVLVAALTENHPKHERALPWLSRAKTQEFELIVSSHTLAELYAVLSALPVAPRISPNAAWRLIHENVERTARVVSLSPKEYGSLIRTCSDLGLSGGIVYDALIAEAARKSKAERILTLNTRHFRRVWQGSENALIEP